MTADLRWPSTRLTDLLGVELPIIQAPMAGATTPALVSAASNAGALGSHGCAYASPKALREAIDEIRGRTNGAYNLNFFVNTPPRQDAQIWERARQRVAPHYAQMGLGEPPQAPLERPPFGARELAMLLETPPRVVSFHFGLPAADAVTALKDVGCVILSSATSPAEARALEDQGADAVIAQGWEAGGHRGVFDESKGSGEVGTFALVPQVVDAVSIPVIAAGGVSDGRGLAAAFMLGADGVQIGTAFLTCPETNTAPAHRSALAAAEGGDTVVTRALSGRPARGIRNRYVEDMAAERDLPAFPQMLDLTGPLNAAGRKADSPDYHSLWAGQAVGLVREAPAADLIARIVDEAQALLNQ